MAGAVEVGPVAALAHHGLQVLRPHHLIGHRVAHHRPEDPGGHVRGPQDAVAEVGAHGQAVGDHRDRLRRGQGARRRLQARASVLRHALAQLAEDGDHATDLLQGALRGRQLERRAEVLHAAGHDAHLLLRRGRQRQHHRVETASQRRREVIDTAIAIIGGGDEVEAPVRLHLGAQLRHREGLLAEHRDEGVLNVGGHTGELLDPGDPARPHGRHDGGGDECRLRGALGQEPGVVPAVAHRLLRGARRALHQECGGSADRRGQVLTYPGLRRSRHPQKE